MTDASYSDLGALDFSDALGECRAGARVTRGRWNDPDKFVIYQPGYPDGVPTNANTARALGIEQGTSLVVRPYLSLRMADGSIVPWTPSQLDLLADDWRVVA